jgi:hypothetical protein
MARLWADSVEATQGRTDAVHLTSQNAVSKLNVRRCIMTTRSLRHRRNPLPYEIVHNVLRLIPPHETFQKWRNGTLVNGLRHL